MPGHLLVMGAHCLDLVLALREDIHQTIDAVAHDAKYVRHFFLDECVDYDVRTPQLRHLCSPLCPTLLDIIITWRQHAPQKAKIRDGISVALRERYRTELTAGRAGPSCRYAIA